VELLGASLPFLASARFVYVLGMFEVLAALALLLGIGVRYMGLLMLALFAQALTIFVISPGCQAFRSSTWLGSSAEGSRTLSRNVRGDRSRLRAGVGGWHGGATGSPKGLSRASH
jgi:hypothetical protein